MPARKVSCPTCGKAAPWSRDNRWRPFCSERCRLIDLGAWVSGDYRLPAEDQTPLHDGTAGMPTDGDQDER